MHNGEVTWVCLGGNDHSECGSRSVAERLRAFAKDCVTQGDMTPCGARMLNRILDEYQDGQR